MNNSPYNLNSDKNSSDEFYIELGKLSRITYESLQKSLGKEISSYSSYLNEINELYRSPEEYSIELLTLAMTWREYISAAKSTNSFIPVILIKLYNIRCKYSILKKSVDIIRGLITGAFVYPKLLKNSSDYEYTHDNLLVLINWLDSTGEFSDEVKRFNNWYTFFKKSSELYFKETIKNAMQQLSQFEKQAEVKLGKYASGVKSFHEKLPFNERWREDALFRKKSTITYYINMLASEVMNWGFKKKFLKTKKRIVLAPACMSKEDGHNCARRTIGGDIICSECTDSCHICQLKRMSIENEFELVIVPHSSSFTKWLKRWENTEECGIIALACPLNIVVGGYQMRELNIPSQCVMLDYSGCGKHWGPDFNATKVNHKRLIKVVENAA